MLFCELSCVIDRKYYKVGSLYNVLYTYIFLSLVVHLIGTY